VNKPIIAIVLWFVFGFVFAWSDRQAVDDKTALFRKKLALLESTKPGGRVIIAGGSNAFWGVSSAALEESLGRPVINIAIPSEIEDPLLMQKLVLKIAQPGDVVVYSSLSFWVKPGVNKERAFRIATNLGATTYLALRPGFLARLAFWWRPYPQEVNPLTAIAQVLSTEEQSDPWSPFMDSHGDYVACEDILVTPVPVTSRRDPARVAMEIAVFRKQLKQKNVLLVNTAPWILVDPAEKPLWTEYYRDILARMKPADVDLAYGHPEVVLRENQAEFCESPWHLKPEQGLERSRYYLRDRVEASLATGLRDDQGDDVNLDEPLPPEEGDGTFES
jgi:hypothetical protein